MQLNSFAFGPAYGGYWSETLQSPVRQPLPHSITGALRPSSFSTDSLLKLQPPTVRMHNTMSTIGIEEYRANADVLREQSILRATNSSIKIGKHEDGTIWVDMENFNDPAGALAKKRATGGETQIVWENVGSNLRIHRMAIGEDTLDEVAFHIDYFASEYAQYKTRIERQYTGDERTAELAKLEQTFALRVEETAGNFAQKVGGFLAESGVAGEQDAIRDSFLDIYEQRKTTYLQFIDKNPDYADVVGTADEWLLTAGDFMGEQLRYALVSQKQEMNITSEHGYSIDDLQAAGTMVKELAKIQDRSQSSNRSEEELGVQLGLAAMKYTVLSGHFNISDGIKSKLDQAFEGFIQGELDRVVAYIDQQRKDPFVRDKEAYAVDYDQLAVLEIIRRMVENLDNDDVNTAFRSDWNTYVALYKNKMQETESGHLARYNPYTSSWVNQNYATDWNRFVQHLSASNDEDRSRYLFKDQMQWMDVKV